MCRACAIHNAPGLRWETRHASPPARCARPDADWDRNLRDSHAGTAATARVRQSPDWRRRRTGQAISPRRPCRRSRATRTGSKDRNRNFPARPSSVTPAAAARRRMWALIRAPLAPASALASRHSGICRARKASSPAGSLATREKNCPKSRFALGRSSGKATKRRPVRRPFRSAAASSSPAPRAKPPERGGRLIRCHRHFTPCAGRRSIELAQHFLADIAIKEGAHRLATRRIGEISVEADHAPFYAIAQTDDAGVFDDRVDDGAWFEVAELRARDAIAARDVAHPIGAKADLTHAIEAADLQCRIPIFPFFLSEPVGA